MYIVFFFFFYVYNRYKLFFSRLSLFLWNKYYFITHGLQAFLTFSDFFPPLNQNVGDSFWLVAKLMLKLNLSCAKKSIYEPVGEVTNSLFLMLKLIVPVILKNAPNFTQSMLLLAATFKKFPLSDHDSVQWIPSAQAGFCCLCEKMPGTPGRKLPFLLALRSMRDHSCVCNHLISSWARNVIVHADFSAANQSNLNRMTGFFPCHNWHVRFLGKHKRHITDGVSEVP